MKQIKLLTLLVTLICGVVACQHKTDSPIPGGGTSTGGGNNGGNNGGNTGGNNGGGNNGGPDTALCFERDILPIFISNCAKAGCHNEASAQDGYVFTSWQKITSKKFFPGDASETELFEKITEDDPDKIMPPPPNAPLTAQQIALIKQWINMGAPNSTNCSSGGCDSTRYAFAADIQPILNTNCKGCHNSTLASGGFSYENHAGVVTAVNSGRFLGAIKHQAGFTAMPQGGNQLSDCQIMKIERWIAGGMPNN